MIRASKRALRHMRTQRKIYAMREKTASSRFRTHHSMTRGSTGQRSSAAIIPLLDAQTRQGFPKSRVILLDPQIPLHTDHALVLIVPDAILVDILVGRKQVFRPRPRKQVAPHNALHACQKRSLLTSANTSGGMGGYSECHLRTSRPLEVRPKLPVSESISRPERWSA